jgi:hypothetical protein
MNNVVAEKCEKKELCLSQTCLKPITSNTFYATAASANQTCQDCFFGKSASKLQGREIRYIA